MKITIVSIILAPIILPIMFIIEFFKAQINFVKECCRITYDSFYQIYWDIKYREKKGGKK